MTNIANVLSERAAMHPDQAAIREVVNGKHRTTTFAELDQAAAAISAELRRNGLKPTHNVLVLHPITAELYGILLALFRTGCTVMLLDPSAGMEHIERCCSLRSPTAFVGSRKAHLLRFTSKAIRKIPKKFVLGGWVPGAATLNFHGNNQDVPVEPCEEDHPALLTFTSGGTGLPKAAIRTHGFLLAQNAVLSRTLEMRAGEIDLATLPVFVLANLAAGVTTIIPDCDLRYPGSFKTSTVLQQVALERPTSTACSPAFIERLANAALECGMSLDSFRRIYTGGAPVTPALLDLVAQAAPGAEVIAVYGSTEAEPISELPRSELTDADRDVTSTGGGLPAGKPVHEITLRVIKDSWGTPLGKLSADDFQLLSLGGNERGEIVVSGDHVLGGYLDGRGDEETKFEVDGRRWHRTGDAGYLDDHDSLWLLGRCHSIIRDSLGVLYPFAVEMVVGTHKDVTRSVLLSHHGRRLLLLELKSGIGDLDTNSISAMVPWAQLDEIRVIPRIPVDRRHNAKVDYPRLHAMLN